MTTPDFENLTDAAANYRHAQTNLNATRDTLAQAVRDALDAGMTISEASRIVGVDRLTIRKWAAQ